jgi:hypothetical protein
MISYNVVLLEIIFCCQSIPEELKEIVPEEKFKKSLTYGADKFSFGLIESTVMFSEGLLLVVAGWLPFAWDFASSFSSKYGLISQETGEMRREIVITSVFVIIIALHDLVVQTPFSLYRY